MSGACQRKVKISIGTDRYTTVSCGTCDLCRQSLLTNFVGRCLLEEESAIKTTFLTFTYANDEQFGATEVIPESERGYADIQRLFKRIRKAGYMFRYMCALEHGKNGQQQMHFHVLFFWVNKVPEHPPIDAQRQMWQFWPHGFTFNAEATTEKFGYVCKYMLKEQTLEEKGKPKVTGNKRQNGYRDPEARAWERANRLAMANAAGFETYSEYKEYMNENPDHLVKYSNHPTFGLGHSSVPDQFKPLRIMAKRLVSAGLPFDRRYKMPKGYYYSGVDVKMVTYFMQNYRMVDEYYRLYCQEYYKKHGKGAPPLRNNANTEDEDSVGENTVVEKIVYGPAFWECGWVDPDLRGQADQWQGAPLPAWIARNKASISKRFKKVVYYSGSNVALWVMHDGRIIAVKETKLTSTKHMSAYSRDRRQSREVVTRGYQRWPVKDARQLLALVRGLKTATQVPTERCIKRAWNLQDSEECPF